MDEIAALFPLLKDERSVFQHWRQLVFEYHVSGKPAHDARLVAAMHRHSVSHILTFNAADFQRYSDVTVISPQDVSSQCSAA